MLDVNTEEYDELLEAIADLRDLIPIEWYEEQGSSVLGAVVGSHYEAVMFIKDYVKELQDKTNKMTEALREAQKQYIQMGSPLDIYKPIQQILKGAV